jgi:dihydroorotate dehydrogenase electron transfer subunit
MLRAEGSRCFLGRALSVAAEEGEQVSFLIAPVGEGTRELSALAGGDQVWVLGPLGNGFDIALLTGGAGRVLLVGGGVGAAPFPLLLAHLGGATGALPGRAARATPSVKGGASGVALPATRAAEVMVLLGFRDWEQARVAGLMSEAASSLRRSGVRCRIKAVSEDAAFGPAEKVTDLLGRELHPGDRLAVCGPRAMAEVVWSICAGLPDVAAWFSLESGVACGVGSCHGCVVILAGGGTARLCREGPVFSGVDIFGGGRTAEVVQAEGQ